VEELRVDFDKIHTLSKWRPRVSWEEGIVRTIRWYAENREQWIGRRRKAVLGREAATHWRERRAARSGNALGARRCHLARRAQGRGSGAIE
jgi:hypothetical protein